MKLVFTAHVYKGRRRHAETGQNSNSSRCTAGLHRVTITCLSVRFSRLKTPQILPIATRFVGRTVIGKFSMRRRLARPIHTLIQK